jgi:FdhD protein
MSRPDQISPREVGRARVMRVRRGRVDTVDDRLAGEEPLEIRAAGPGEESVAVAVTLRTPGGEAELAVGFLRTEGLVGGPADIADVSYGDPERDAQPDDIVLVHLTRPFDASLIAERHFVATASCGICGKASIDEVAVRVEPIPSGPVVEQSAITALPDRLLSAQAVFEATGGLHAAALFDPKGTLIAVREDVGRHNALDKLIGAQFLAGSLPLNDRIVLLSGRIGFELVQKAAVAGVPIVCAVGAPSDLAVEAGERLGVTLVGFLRDDSFNVYTHSERIALG